jgi:Tfp pilus assembly protein PilO
MARHQQFIILFIVVGVLLIGGIVWVWHSQSQNLQAVRVERDEVQKKYEERLALANRLEEFQLEVRQIRAELAYLKCLPLEEKDYLPAMLIWMRQLALATRVDVIHIRPVPTPAGQAPPAPALKARRMSVTVRGPYKAVYAFIKQLTRFPQLIAVQELSRMGVTGGEAEQSPVTLEVALQAELSILEHILPQELEGESGGPEAPVHSAGPIAAGPGDSSRPNGL